MLRNTHQLFLITRIESKNLRAWERSRISASFITKWWKKKIIAIKRISIYKDNKFHNQILKALLNNAISNRLAQSKLVYQRLAKTISYGVSRQIWSIFVLFTLNFASIFDKSSLSEKKFKTISLNNSVSIRRPT